MIVPRGISSHRKKKTSVVCAEILYTIHTQNESIAADGIQLTVLLALYQSKKINFN
ncbi:hypothetical protein psageK4_054 [Pseudomonas phage psageK4]|uniref:Uncharacterized protein n=2 Tax=Otagovirus TaxID=2560197 RepID=A0AAE9BS03_9CAUD|nr:hypothetical protein QGX14_gp054 [Pseudomonas phage psageK4]YP_010766964.1 hypothetical protein QGX15_gp059 [Pseudomonas phage psageK4e]QXV71708.1 hypothetical protein psageK4_054 [Pseudomonas phage psageK4]UAW53507.1 hypothetical protein psageK4e_059 [Pseudomonas phage psageK4e]